MDYNSTLDSLIKSCNIFSLVISNDITNEEKHTLNVLRQYLLRKENTNTWPGTKLYGYTADVYYFSYTKESKEILKSMVGNFREWLHPLPEDLCFYYNDTPIFASTAHENDAFFMKEVGNSAFGDF